MPEQQSGSFVVHRVRDIQVIEFMTDALLDQANIERLGDDLAELVAKSGHPKIVISFANIEHVSSAVLGILIATHKQVKKMRGELRLASISERIYEVFKITRMDKMLKIYESPEVALLKF